MNLYEPAAVQFHTDPLAHSITRKDQVLKDGVVHCGECAASGGLLLIFCSAFPSWLGRNPPLSNEDYVFPAKLFLQFTNQLDLDFLEGFQPRNWYKNYDGFPATTNFNFLGHGYVELPQQRLEIRVHLQLEQHLRDARLELVRLLTIGLDDLGARAEHGSPECRLGKSCDLLLNYGKHMTASRKKEQSQLPENTYKSN